MPEETTILVRRAREGDADGLAALIERVSPLLLTQARYRMRGALAHIDPEDVVQEVWVRSLPKLDGLGQHEGRETPTLIRFLSTTLLHRVHELLRERLRSVRQDVASGASNIPEETAGVVSRVVRSERKGELWRMLESLPQADREILILRGIEQQENQAVADTLGTTANALSLRYNRLLERLRSRLSGSILDEL